MSPRAISRRGKKTLDFSRIFYIIAIILRGGTYANLGNINASSWVCCAIRRASILPFQNYQEKRTKYERRWLIRFEKSNCIFRGGDK